MKHAVSEWEKSWRSRPFAHTGPFWGGATVACIVLPYYFWEMGVRAFVEFIPYLLLAAGVGILVVVIRRVLRPPWFLAGSKFVEVTPEGIWNVTRKSRTLLLAAAQVQLLRVSRSNYAAITQIDIETDGDRTSFSGLADMETFLTDIKSTFKSCRVVD